MVGATLVNKLGGSLTGTGLDKAGWLAETVELAVASHVQILITHRLDEVALQLLLLAEERAVVDVAHVHVRVYLYPRQVDVLQM